MKRKWNIGELLQTSSAYWRGCALQAGVRLDLFTVIGNEELMVEEIAGRIGSDRRGTDFLLNALAGMGLLTKENALFRNTEQSGRFLSKKSPEYVGYIILHHHHILDGWAQLHEAVLNGAPVQKRSYGEEIERECFLMGMFNLAMINGPGVAAQVDLTGRKRLLDLAGGPGTYAVHFCRANPELTVALFDRPATEPFARETIAGFNLTDRIDFYGGDIITDPIPGGPCDAAWLSHILHSNGPEQCRRIIDKTVQVLEPGGLIMIHEFILDNSRAAPEFPALFSLNMLINNPQGRAYSQEELTVMLEGCGVKDVWRHPFQGPNDSALLCGIV